jgi:hypothetical protein
MIKLLLPLLLTVAIAPNALPNTELTQRLPCEEIYIELLRGVEEGYIQKEAADEVYKRCVGFKE